MYDVLRADRCISVHSLEARVPFGDLDFVSYCMAIDPEKKMLVQYDMEHMELPSVYNCESAVPVLIWNSEYRIDLGEMFDTIAFLWEAT